MALVFVALIYLLFWFGYNVWVVIQGFFVAIWSYLSIFCRVVMIMYFYYNFFSFFAYFLLRWIFLLMWITDEDVADTASGMFRHISIHAIKFAGIIGPIIINCFVFAITPALGLLPHWKHFKLRKQMAAVMVTLNISQKLYLPPSDTPFCLVLFPTTMKCLWLALP